ncbi:peptidoglycan-binding domain-containing protein [Muricoccus radiodurans]|uniref:peptidoglycan-binding domain-containing protein n=1 Tax=Muricoccus radiodurans TaxID=2231721 RepID=UPI003CEE0BAF
MTGRAALLAALAAVPLLAAPARAQPEPGLNFVQPLGTAGITIVQDRLRGAGAYTGRVDGIWGPDSQQALERFQQRNGLQVTGQLNPATAATLRVSPADLLGAPPAPPAAVAVPVPAPPPPEAPLSIVAVRNIQESLRVLGFYREGVDGIWGPSTQAAIERFQQGRGLQVNGQITPATAQALGLDPNNLEVPRR